ncbi:unnamed protein product, partial [Polarella glacialis]
MQASQVSPRSARIGAISGLEKHFEVIRKLGEGAFGTAQLVRERATGQPRVLKAVRKGGDLPAEAIAQEVNVLRALDHPNIIRIFGHFEDDRFVYILMEPAEGGELLTVIKEIYEQRVHALSETWAARVFQQCLSAIAYCHQRGILHKDLKSENIMLLSRDRVASPHVVIIDFGVAELLSTTRGPQGQTHRNRGSALA